MGVVPEKPSVIRGVNAAVILITSFIAGADGNEFLSATSLDGRLTHNVLAVFLWNTSPVPALVTGVVPSSRTKPEGSVFTADVKYMYICASVLGGISATVATEVMSSLTHLHSSGSGAVNLALLNISPLAMLVTAVVPSDWTNPAGTAVMVAVR